MCQNIAQVQWYSQFTFVNGSIGWPVVLVRSSVCRHEDKTVIFSRGILSFQCDQVTCITRTRVGCFSLARLASEHCAQSVELVPV